MALKTSVARQLSFPNMCPISDAVTQRAAASIEERGAIFTRREVVDFILNLLGYSENKPLHTLRILEPSCGDGDFLFPIIDRLLNAAKRHKIQNAVSALANAIYSVELHKGTFEKTFERVTKRLVKYGLANLHAKKLAASWMHQGDFLLHDFAQDFNFVVGNPPYVRQELIPDNLMSEYRSRYRTIYDRADLYVPFIEHSLNLLSPNGQLGFICADRWMKNRYGGPLRNMIANSFHLKVYVDMFDTPAFNSEVIAYPAITIVSREAGNVTRIARRPEITKKSLSALATDLNRKKLRHIDGRVQELAGVARGAEPWVLESADQLALVRRLEAEFPLLEEVGCKVGIGVATGADKAFIGPYDELNVESDRKLPLVMTRDILDGHVRWRGFGVINPFNNDGGLVELEKYPRLRRYLEKRKSQIAKRHVAEKSPANWYRTIDRIYPSIALKPKLLIPDIKGEAHIVYEDGQLYPHHNLYFITSDEWNIKALQAVLRSGIARLFVSTYSTRMRGGYLRFQAQYLRRIRIPSWNNVSAATKQELIAAADHNNLFACNRAAFKLFALSASERTAVSGTCK